MKYLIIDNNFQNRNTVIEAENINDALSKGSSILKTCNIRAIPTLRKKGNINKFGFVEM